jgi:hypothetical protein
MRYQRNITGPAAARVRERRSAETCAVDREPGAVAGRVASVQLPGVTAVWHAAAIILLALLTPSGAGAQLPELEPGTRVRVQAPRFISGEVEGTIVAHLRDSLRIKRRFGQPVTVPLAYLTHVQVSGGRSRLLGAERGSMWGAAAGLAIGAIAALAPEVCTESCGHEPVDHFIYTPLAGAAVGAGVGALLGAEKWRTVPLPTPVTIEPGWRGGIVIALRLRR